MLATEVPVLLGAIISERMGNVERRLDPTTSGWQWRWTTDYDGSIGPEGEWRDVPVILFSDESLAAIIASLDHLSHLTPGDSQPSPLFWSVHATPTPGKGVTHRDRWYVCEIKDPSFTQVISTAGADTPSAAIGVATCKLFGFDILAAHRELFPHRYLEDGT